MLIPLFPVTRLSIILMLSICLNTRSFCFLFIALLPYPSSPTFFNTIHCDIDKSQVCFISLSIHLSRMTICLRITVYDCRFSSFSPSLFTIVCGMYSVENHSNSFEKKEDRETLKEKIWKAWRNFNFKICFLFQTIHRSVHVLIVCNSVTIFFSENRGQ